MVGTEKKSMWKKLFTPMLALCVCFSALGTSAMAAKGHGYYDDGDDYFDGDYDVWQTDWDGAEGIALSEEELTLPAGETEELFVYYDNEAHDEYEGSVTWKSDEPSVASVKNGVISAKKAGEACITAIAAIDGEEYEAYCDIVVADVALSATKLTLTEGQTVVLKVKDRYPEDDTVDEWEVEKGGKSIKLSKKANQSVTITAKKAGAAKVAVFMDSGAEAACTVTVKKATASASLAFSKKNIELEKGSKVKLSVTRKPKNANDMIYWSSSRKKVATVDAKGEVAAKGTGKTVITAKTAKGKKATCTVTVTAPARLTLKSPGASLKIGKSTVIKVKSGDKKGLSYKSSNAKVAAVSQKGKVTARKPGVARITVTAKNGSKAIFTVKVRA